MPSYVRAGIRKCARIRALSYFLKPIHPLNQYFIHTPFEVTQLSKLSCKLFKVHNSLDVRAGQKNVRADFQQPLRMKFSNFSKVPIESKSKSPEFQRFLPL